MTSAESPSPSLIQEAQTLKARIHAGEKIPLEELKAFILKANSSLSTQRKSKETPKDSDVDFF